MITTKARRDEPPVRFMHIVGTAPGTITFGDAEADAAAMVSEMRANDRKKVTLQTVSTIAVSTLAALALIGAIVSVVRR